jgi:hypothetical protein
LSLIEHSINILLVPGNLPSRIFPTENTEAGSMRSFSLLTFLVLFLPSSLSAFESGTVISALHSQWATLATTTGSILVAVSVLHLHASTKGLVFLRKKSRSE